MDKHKLPYALSTGRCASERIAALVLCEFPEQDAAAVVACLEPLSFDSERTTLDQIQEGPALALAGAIERFIAEEFVGLPEPVEPGGDNSATIFPDWGGK